MGAEEITRNSNYHMDGPKNKLKHYLKNQNDLENQPQLNI